MDICLRQPRALANLASVLVLVLMAKSEVSGLCQGNVEFRTQVASAHIDARVSYLDGTPVGFGFTAQLYGGLPGTPVEALDALLPTTTFFTNPALVGYVMPIGHFIVSNIPPGQFATLQMRAYDGQDWDSSMCRGESNPVTVLLSGGANPNAYLVGLQPFQVDCFPVPEPSIFVLAVLGGSILLVRCSLRRCRDRWTKCPP